MVMMTEQYREKVTSRRCSRNPEILNKIRQKFKWRIKHVSVRHTPANGHSNQFFKTNLAVLKLQPPHSAFNYVSQQSVPTVPKLYTRIPTSSPTPHFTTPTFPTLCDMTFLYQIPKHTGGRNISLVKKDHLADLNSIW